MPHGRTLFFAGLIAVAGVFGAQGIASSLAAQPVNGAAPAVPVEITIMSATYGVDQRIVDVTARVNTLVRPGTEPVVVGPATFGVLDPAPNEGGKTVVVTYQFGLQSKTITVPDGQILSHSILVQYAGGALPSPPAGAKLQALNEDQLAGVVFIEGDKSLATGFLARIHEKDGVVTNLHVLVENEKLTIRNLVGGVVETQGIIGAVGADMVLLPLAKPTGQAPSLKTAGDVLQSGRIWDRVVMVGNHPDRAPTQTSGLITGFAPDRIEVDAQFQLGNSGSPLFDLACQQVVGVVTFRDTVVLDPNGFPARPVDPTLRRWFGSRLDAVTKWEAIDWTKWRTQVRQVTEFHDASLAVWAVYRGALNEAAKDLHLRAAVERFRSRLTPSELATVGASTYSLEQARELLRVALAYAEDGTEELANGDFYDYFRTSPYWAVNVPDQVKFRTQLIKALTAADNDLPTFARRLRQ